VIKFSSLEFLDVYRISQKIKNAVYHLQISAFVREIFSFEKGVKYASEKTDDVKHLTQYSIRYIDTNILVSL